MIDQCFIFLNPAIMMGLALGISAIALWRVFTIFHGERSSFILVMAFLVMSALSLIFIPCWAFMVSIIELAMALYLRGMKLHEILVK